VTLPRLLFVVLVLTTLGALAAGVAGVVAGRPSVVVTPERPTSPESRLPVTGNPAAKPGRPTDAPRRRVAADRRVAALAVLRAWDVRRAAAWAAGDEAALAALYTDGSAAGRRDRAMLGRYGARGLRVRGMRMQVLAGKVLSRTAGRIVLVVTDRLAHGVAVGRGTRVVLPRDRATRRTIVLRRVAGEWRVAQVWAQASPVARTAVTSRSRKP
jgi:hypothetical protein